MATKPTPAPRAPLLHHPAIKGILAILTASVLAAEIYLATLPVPAINYVHPLQIIVTPLTLLLCGLALFVLIRGRQLTWITIITIVGLFIVAMSGVVHKLTHPAGDCFYDAAKNLNADFVSHMNCPSDTATAIALNTVAGPITSVIFSLLCVISIGTLLVLLVRQTRR